MLVELLLCALADREYDVANGYRVIERSLDDDNVAIYEKGQDQRPAIPAKIVEVHWDRRFVVAKQQHTWETGRKWARTEAIPGQFSYWILDAHERKAHGPLTFAGFEDWRKELGIPGTLRLAEEQPLFRNPLAAGAGP